MHAITIFLSSFLLFSVQPVITKQILPTFGGASGVWLLSLLFFQTLLLGGYFYSYAINHYLNHKKRIAVHATLLIVSLLSLPILSQYQPDVENQFLKILLILLLTVGFPYFMLSTTTPLIQSFFAQRFPLANVYRLYSLSNLASLIALFSYPLFFEKHFSILQQSNVWSITYGVFVLVSIVLLVTALKYHHQNPVEIKDKEPILINTKLKWLAYSFLGSALLSAVTSHITQNIASIPLLWIIPLAIYLLSFIIAFDYPKLFDKRFLEYSLLFIIPFLCFSMLWSFSETGIIQATYSAGINIFIYTLGLFLAVYYLNGLIVKEKPPSENLTIFYVYIALGGVLGALFISVLAPLIFSSLIEMPLLLTALIVLITLQFNNKIFPVLFLLLTIGINLAVYIGLNQHTIAAKRGFYGALKVNELVEPKTQEKTRFLIHGSIMHGFQTLNENALIPTSYFHKNSGLGQAIELKQKEKEQINMGVIGLGVGTISSYAREKDHIRFFEIDPLIVELAEKYFTYMSQAKGQIDHEVGDGRLLVEKEPDNYYDILTIDAFSGDAIPVHLLTNEAVNMYLKKIKEDGIIAFHISSSYVDLAQPLVHIAKHNNLHFNIIEINSDKKILQTESKWILLSRNELKNLNNSLPSGYNNKQPLWTDNYSNLMDILK